ncbi:MAG: NAD(P)H-dependent flavin oxidoreductase [Gammaproteobacteria bacterium]
MNAWRQTRVTERLGLTLPIVQGPFGGGLSSTALTAAVSEAGGLGSFGMHHLDGKGIDETVAAIRSRTTKPFAVNLWLPFENSEEPACSDQQFDYYAGQLMPYFSELGCSAPKRPKRFSPRFEEQIEAVFRVRPAVFSFVYGVPETGILKRCRELDIVTLGTATTVDEALLLERAGVDMVVASGFEAGGHRVSFLRPAEESLTGTFSLIPQVADIVDLPLIAAGGIADGRGIAAAFLLGAEAVQLGTAFLACDESGTTDRHRAELFSRRSRYTGLTRVFSGRLARGIRNRLMNEGERLAIAPYPVQSWLTGQLKNAAIPAERSDLMSLWSGQSAPLLKHRRVKDLLLSLRQEIEAAYRKSI